MNDRDEMVIIELAPEGRLRVYGQITAQMEKLGYNPCDYKALNLGFELPPDWPNDMNDQLTMAQLIVVAYKLRMRIIIGDINLVPRKEDEKGVAS